MVSNTSKLAYITLLENGKLSPARLTICEILKAYKSGLTRAEIAHISQVSNKYKSYQINSVCGRVNELIESRLVVEVGTKKCSVTGSTANILKLV